MTRRPPLQPQLFDPGPPEYEPGDWYHFSTSPDFDPQRDRELHMGTELAAGELGLNRSRGPGWVHHFKIRRGAMANTPDNPSSEALANALVNTSASSWFYDSDAIKELGSRELYEQRRDEVQKSRKGMYYTNMSEDAGSISAVVRSADQVEHLGMDTHRPTEVKEYHHPTLGFPTGGRVTITDIGVEGSRVKRSEVEEPALFSGYTTHSKSSAASTREVLPARSRRREFDESASIPAPPR